MASEIRVNQIQNRSGLTTTTLTDTGVTIAGILTVSENLNVGGVLTYEDVTNIDSVGVITARAAVSIADSIVHTGDTNTAIRFPAADTFSVETAGSERLRITSAGKIGIGTDNPGQTLHLSAASGDVYNRVDTNVNGGLLVYVQGTQRGVFANDSAFSGTTTDIGIGAKGNIIFRTGTSSYDERLRITSDGHLQIPNDTGQIKLGASQDFQIFHNGTDNKIIAQNGELLIQCNTYSLRSENGSSTYLNIDSNGKIGIGTNTPDNEVEINGSAKFTSGGDVGGPPMLVSPHPDVTLANNASTTLSLGNRFTGLVIVNGNGNDTPGAIFALASASSYSADGVSRLMIQNHPASNITDLTITSPSHGGTHQFQLNQTGSATKTYKIFAFGIFGT